MSTTETNEKDSIEGAAAAAPSVAQRRQLLVVTLNKLRRDHQGCVLKQTELKEEQSEHNLVIEYLQRLDQTRTCFHAMGPFMTQRSVSDVIPLLLKTRDNLTQTIAQFDSEIAKKQKEVQDFVERNQAELMRMGAEIQPAPASPRSVAAAGDASK